MSANVGEGERQELADFRRRAEVEKIREEVKASLAPGTAHEISNFRGPAATQVGSMLLSKTVRVVPRDLRRHRPPKQPTPAP